MCLQDKKALSPVISAIILITVTVAVAIAAATWLGSMTFSFMTVEELQVTNCQWAPDVSYADLTVNNFGTESVTIDEVKVNGELVNDVSIVTGSADLNAGENAVFRITDSFISSNSYTFSIITTKGTRIEYVSRAPSGTPTTPQYAVDFVLGAGGASLTPGDGSYAGDVAISATADTDYVFNEWQSTGSITFADSGSASTTATINGAGTVTATFTQNPYEVSFEQIGAGVAPNVDYQIDGGSTVVNTVPFTVLVDDGSVISYTYQATVAGSSGTQYVRTTVAPASPQIVTGAMTITGNYKTQYQLTMSTSFGTTTPAVGTTWYDAGSVVTISANAPASGAGERYVWNGWTGTGSGSYTGTNNPATGAITMNAPITETASWTHQYQITVTASPNGAIGGTFRVTYTQGGTTHTNEQHTTSWTTWADAGTDVTVSQPQDPYSGYNFDHYDPTATVSMTTVRTITLAYTQDTQTGTIYPEANPDYTVGGYTSGSRYDMQSSNNQYYVAHSTGYNDALAYDCSFDIDDISVPSEDDVTRLDITLEGHYSSSSKSQTLYIYNVATSNWELKATTTMGTSDQTVTFSITSACNNYIDNHGNILISVRSSGGTSTYYYYNDYFKIDVTYTP
jgi:hypothetical protein